MSRRDVIRGMLGALGLALGGRGRASAVLALRFVPAGEPLLPLVRS